MAIPTYGTVTLTAISASGSDVTLTTDPDKYMLDWPKRRSVFEGIGGTVTVQDFGKFAKDCVVRADSGSTQWINKDVVQAMDKNEQIKGGTWQLEDFEGNDFVVSIEKWAPVMVKGMAIAGLYTYELALRVHSMTTLRGSAYMGN